MKLRDSTNRLVDGYSVGVALRTRPESGWWQRRRPPMPVPIRGIAQVLCAWSHPGRLRSEAAFAMLAGVAPLEASSGRVVRQRLNRGGDETLAIDTMEDRPLVGTTGWQEHALVLEVAAAAAMISFGAGLSGEGELLVSKLAFEEVGDEVPVTAGPHRPRQPLNLDFSQA